MHLELISRKLPGLSPYSKYFFILWFKKHGEAEVILSIQELSQESGLSTKLVRKSIKELLDTGLLHRERNAKLKGYPDFTYHVKNIPAYLKVKKRFSSINEAERDDVQSIKEKLLNSMLEVEALNSLSIPQKLLLIVLWVKSSELGIIENTGVGKLAGAVGCSKDSVKRHLRALTDKNLLVVICKGFTAKKLFGVKDNIYLLNPPGNYPYFISGVSQLSEKNSLILNEVREMFARLKQELFIDDELLGGLEADFNKKSVASYFLYWFWRYLFSRFGSFFHGEPMKPYLKLSIENLTASDEKLMAKSLFSKVLFKMWESDAPILIELVKQVHGLVVNIGMEMHSLGFEQYSGAQREKLTALLPECAVYLKLDNAKSK